MHAPALQRLIDALEDAGLDLGDVSIPTPEHLALVVDVAARNRAAGREKLRRERAEIRGMQTANNRSFAVEPEYPIE